MEETPTGKDPNEKLKPESIIHGLPAAAWKLLGSMKFGIGVLILLAALSIPGAIIPQNVSLEMYAARFGPLLSSIIITFGFDDVFKSPLFIATLAVMTLSMAACTMNRLKILVRAPGLPEQMPAGLDLKSFTLSETRDITKYEPEALRGALLSAGFRTRKLVPTETGARFKAVRGSSHRWGSFLTHITIFIILAGVALGRIGAVDSYISIPQGETFKDPEGRFEIKLEKFKAEFDALGRASDYSSEVQVLQSGTPQRRDVIRVNHPLKYKGLYFFQSGYRLDSADIRILIRGKEHARLTLHPAEAGYPLAVTEDEFLPDDRDPAVNLYIYDSDNDTWRGSWLRASEPWAIRDTVIQLQGINTQSVLQVKRDRGLPLIWLGFGVLLAGLVFTFYVTRNELFGCVEKGSEPDSGYILTLAGRFGGIPVEAQRNFQRAVQIISRRLSC